MMGTKQLMSTSVSTGDYSMMGGSSAGRRFGSFFVGLILPSRQRRPLEHDSPCVRVGIGRSVGWTTV